MARYFSAVSAFFKRRWLSLLMLVFLVVGTATDRALPFFEKPGGALYIATYQGFVGIQWASQPIEWELYPKEALHVPMMGLLPSFEWQPHVKYLAVPYWLPLCAIIGWLVFRELHWRERRAKESEVQDAS